MIMVFLLAYVGFAFIAFKVIKIKVSPFSLAVTVLMGASMVAGILTVWKFSAPITDQTTLSRKITNLLADPNSKELITKIFAQESQPLKKGDPIWEVDSRPNQYSVNQAIAQAAANEQDVLFAEAGVETAAAQVEKAKANQALADAKLKIALKTQDLNPGAVAELNVEVVQQNRIASDAAVNNAIANQNVAEFSLTTARNNLKASQARLGLAQLNLSQNIKRAPADGYLMNFQTVEGTMTTTLIAQSQGLFLNTSDPGVVVAVYPQNLLKNVESGNAVEIAFKSLPGQIVTGKVDKILGWTGEGQLQRASSNDLPVVKNLRSRGFLAVRITIDDSNIANSLPLGAAGSVAIYTNVAKPFHVISQITIRIKMWMNYLPI